MDRMRVLSNMPGSNRRAHRKLQAANLELRAVIAELDDIANLDERDGGIQVFLDARRQQFKPDPAMVTAKFT